MSLARVFGVFLFFLDFFCFCFCFFFGFPYFFLHSFRLDKNPVSFVIEDPRYPQMMTRFLHTYTHGMGHLADKIYSLLTLNHYLLPTVLIDMAILDTPPHSLDTQMSQSP